MPSAVISVTAVTSGLGVLLNSAVLALVLSQGRKRYHYLFAGVLAICAIWDLCIFLMMIRNDHVREVQALGYVIAPCFALPALIYHFSCCYLEQPREKTTILLWLVAFVSIVIIVSGIAGRIDGVLRYSWGNIFRPDEKMQTMNMLAMPIWFLGTLTPCFFIFRAYRREREALARRHLLYILVSLAAISLAVVKVVVVLGVEQGFFLTLGMLFTDVSAAIVGLAIIKDRLFDITPVIKLGLIYSVLAMLLIFLFSFFEHMLASYVAERVGGHSEVLHAIAIAVTIGLLMPIKRRVEHTVDNYFTGKRVEF